jgi:hypothetical protein
VVEPELQAAWRQVILRAPIQTADELAPSSRRYWLGGILASDPILAFEWLRSQLPTRAQRKLFWLLGDEPVARALHALTAELRIALIAELPAELATGDLARDLVAAEPEAFRALLSRRDLSAVHLGPLRRIPDEVWWRLAGIAIEFAIAPRKVAEAAFRPSVLGGGGSEAEYHARWREAFQSHENSSDPGLAAIAREGMIIAAREVEAAQARDKQLAMKGL